MSGAGPCSRRFHVTLRLRVADLIPYHAHCSPLTSQPQPASPQSPITLTQAVAEDGWEWHSGAELFIGRVTVGSRRKSFRNALLFWPVSAVSWLRGGERRRGGHNPLMWTGEARVMRAPSESMSHSSD
ncbi:hypothetical protein E2C01_039887 [Portunus trituberculatus]|uniref:Uncharacterized protein n=1 Tax=Portunus trituberculatus TaxID=210409 RepID=A0A5B7FMG2_PORTR|nr:hypothetical protein [Portunus trituberculatus]